MVKLQTLGGTPISNGYGCKAHTSKGWGIRWEHNLKKWGNIGWEAKFWFKIIGHWVRILLLIFQWALQKQEFEEKKLLINLLMKLKQKVAFCGSRMQKIRGLWVRAIEEPTFHQKMWGLWVTAETISKNMGSLGDSSTERGLWSLTSTSPP